MRTGDELIECLPSRMRKARRWLVWRSEVRSSGQKAGKIPYYLDGSKRGRGGSLDDAQDTARLGTFAEALALVQDGKFHGLGFALGPDGTGQYWQGIDFDDTANNGLEQLASCLPGYVETSPSGNGVHAIGYGRAFKALGSNGSGIEAYSGKRFFTVTGESLCAERKMSCLAEYVENELTPAYSKHFHRDIASHESQQSKDSHDSQLYMQGGGGGGEGGIDIEQIWKELPTYCCPQTVGQRNSALFKLARHLKSRYPTLSEIDLCPIVRRWHQEHLSVIGTKPWMVTWVDFRTAWKRVKVLEGEGALDMAKQGIDPDKPVPESLLVRGYDHQIYMLVQLCQQLAEIGADQGKFYLGGRTAAGVIGTNQPTANKCLNMLVSDGILEVVKKGALLKGRGAVATTYKYLGVN